MKIFFFVCLIRSRLFWSVANRLFLSFKSKMWKFISSKLNKRKAVATIATLIGGGSLAFFAPKLFHHHGPQPLHAKEETKVKKKKFLLNSINV